MLTSDDIEGRKNHHLDLCLNEPVEAPGSSALFEGIQLVHDALPELSLEGLQLDSEVLGRRLRWPLLMVGMTGGTRRAGEINRVLARAAQASGVAFGVGSQRAMAQRPEALETYRVRDVAPDVLLFGNIGAQQIVELGVEAVKALVEDIEADAIFVHLNPAQELVQPGGDRSFVGCLDAIRRLVDVLGPRVWVKETGCGISRRVAEKLVAAGVGGIDVSGAGGTSWTKVESLRAEGGQRALGERISAWGIPTAAAVMANADLPVPIIASGGVRSGLDVAKSLALGASLGGMALPFLKAHEAGGLEGVLEKLEQVERELRSVMLLTGSGNLAALRRAPRVLSSSLERWVQSLRAGA